MNTSISPKRIVSNLRKTILGLVLASSSIFLVPSAFAQDNIYVRSFYCPVDTVLAIDTGEISDPYMAEGLLFSHFAELVFVAGGTESLGGPQAREYVDISYENPLRTLKRGNRLVKTSGCTSSLGKWFFTLAITAGP